MNPPLVVVALVSVLAGIVIALALYALIAKVVATSAMRWVRARFRGWWCSVRDQLMLGKDCD